METTNNNNEFVRQVAEQKYEFGFTTDVHTDIIDTEWIYRHNIQFNET